MCGFSLRNEKIRLCVPVLFFYLFVYLFFDEIVCCSMLIVDDILNNLGFLTFWTVSKRTDSLPKVQGKI